MAETQNDQKTEAPTPRRLEKALEEGQIAFSTELMGGLLLLAGVLFMMAAGRWFFGAIMTVMRVRVTQFEPMTEHPRTILNAFRDSVIEVGLACLGLLVPLFVLTILASVLQTQFNFSTKPLEWKWNKLNPVEGVKKIFSSRSVVKGLVAMAKAGVIVATAWFLTRARFDEITVSNLTSFDSAVETGVGLILAVSLTTALLMVVVGAADFGFQKWKHWRDLHMSMQEIRDEHKEHEGDPMIKARIRKMMNEIGRKRTLQEVPTASVVITNPTHFAVALRYNPGEDDAPVVVAKGADLLARRIIQIARENGVAVIERKPLARYLYANVDIGKSIPFELYQAVAEILNYIRRRGNNAA